MTKQAKSELIIVRSLTESELGIFAAHRNATRSRQRAFNINAKVARRLLSPSLYAGNGGEFDCICVFGREIYRSYRLLHKVQKNWRLGGDQFEGRAFAQLDSKDFLLLRSVAENDGRSPFVIRFISKKSDQIIHNGLVRFVETKLVSSMVVFEQGTSGFSALDEHCPQLP